MLHPLDSESPSLAEHFIRQQIATLPDEGILYPESPRRRRERSGEYCETDTIGD
jgi:hypothetical protein